jgi:DNA polymerase-3 subunit epsilon
MRQIILDTETTGFRPGGIVSLAAIEMVDGELTGAFAHYHINPKMPCDPGATKVHGLTDEYLATCPTFSNVIGPLDTFLGASPIIAHNAPFDMSFLEAEYRRESEASGFAWRVVNPVRCTLSKATVQRGSGKGRNTLDTLTAEYKVQNFRGDGRHGALVDALTLFGVYRALWGAEPLSLVQSQLDHYLNAGFGVHGSFQFASPGSPAVPSAPGANPPGVPADIRSVG